VPRRRAACLSLVVLTAAATAGCTTFSDNDAVARVGDVELSSDALTTTLADRTTDDNPPAAAVDDTGRADGNASRQAVTEWIREQLIESGTFDDQYAADPSVLGVACLDVAIAIDQADAESLIARLEGGEAWDDVVAPIEEAIGYESAQACQPLSTYADALGEDVGEQLGTLVPGDAPQIIDAGESGGFAVIRARAPETVDSEELVSAMVASRPPVLESVLSAIYVDPRIGSFDRTSISVVAVD
jgi:hypothetical protein